MHEGIQDSNASTATFQTVLSDRDCRKSGKKKGGRVALFVNNKWCNASHITVKGSFRSPDIELITVSLRPDYLPKEFTCAIIIVVYVPPSVDADAACDIICSVTARLQT